MQKNVQSKNMTKAVIALAALAFMILAASFAAIAFTADDASAEDEYVAQIGDDKYTTLTDAVNAAESNDTIFLLKDIEISSTLIIEKTVDIDLNGKSLTGDGTRAVWVKSGVLTLLGEGTVSVTEGIGSTSSAIRVGDNSAKEGAGLIIGEKATVNSSYSYALSAFGKNSSIFVTINGTVSATGDNHGAFANNGTSGYTSTEVTVNSTGTVSSDDDYAIYFPGNGTLTIDGTVSGYGGLEIKSGSATVSISDKAIVEATAKEVTHVKNNDGASTSGYAIAVVENSGYTGSPNVTVNGGSVIGRFAIIADDAVEKEKKGVITVNGGSFTDLPSAVTYSADKVSIKLAKDAEGAGIFLIAGSKDITIDLNEFTYTCTGPAVGSTGTQTQAFHLEEGNTVVLKNGTVTSTDESGVKMLVQNYCDLTVESMTLDGTQLPGSSRYVLSNNCGTVSIKDTTVTAKSGDFAMDSCKYKTYTAPIVTVSGKSVFNGKIEVTGGTVILKDGATVNGQVRVGENKDGGIAGGSFTLETGAAIDYKDNYAVVVFGMNVANINGTVNGLIGTNGYLYNAGSTINIGSGAVIDAGNNIAVYLPSGSLNVTGGEITGSTAIYFKAKILNVTSGTITATGEKVAVKENWDGGDATGDAIVIHNMNYPDADNATVSINGANITSANASKVAYYVGTDSTDMSITSDVDIDGITAKIGNVYYTSLADALDAVKENETITVLKDLTVSSSITVPDKSITIDFSGKKITADGLGSYNVIQIGGYGSGPVFASDIIIKNAEFCGTGAGNTSVNCIQAEISGNLTIDACKFNDFDGLNREIRIVTSSAQAGISITGCSFDRNMGTEGDVIKFSGTPGSSYVFDNNTVFNTTTGETLCIKFFALDSFGFTVAEPAAQIGKYYYDSLEMAIGFVQTNETVTVLKDLTINSSIQVTQPKDFTLDFNGKKITADGLGSFNMIQIGGYGSGPVFTNNLVIKNAEFCGTGAGNTSVNCIQAEISGNLTIDACKFNDFNGLNREIRVVTYDGASVAVNNCKFDNDLGAEGDILKISGVSLAYAFTDNEILEKGDLSFCRLYYGGTASGMTIGYPEAKIGETCYYTLLDAATAATPNDVIFLLKDSAIDEESEITVNEIDVKAGVKLTNNGTLKGIVVLNKDGGDTAEFICSEGAEFDGTIVSPGSNTLAGQFTAGTSGLIARAGSLIIEGDFEESEGKIVLTGSEVKISGSIDSDVTIEVAEDSKVTLVGDLENNGTIVNNGTIDLSDKELTNTSDAVIDSNNGALSGTKPIENEGRVIVKTEDSELVDGGNIVKVITVYNPTDLMNAAYVQTGERIIRLGDNITYTNALILLEVVTLETNGFVLNFTNNSNLVCYGNVITENLERSEGKSLGIVIDNTSSVIIQDTSTIKINGKEWIGADGYVVMGSESNITITTDGTTVFAKPTAGNVTVPEGKNLTIDSNISLIIPDRTKFNLLGTATVYGGLSLDGEKWIGSDGIIALADGSYVTLCANDNGGVDAEIVGEFTVKKDLTIAQKDSVTVTKGDAVLTNSVSVYGKLIIKDGDDTTLWTAPAAYPDSNAIMQFGMKDDVPGFIIIMPNNMTGGVIVVVSIGTTLQHDMTVGESDMLQVWGTCAINEGVTLKVAGALMANGKTWTSSEKIGEYNEIIGLSKDSYILVKSNTNGGVDAEIVGAFTVKKDLTIAQKDSLTVAKKDINVSKDAKITVSGELTIDDDKWIGSDGIIALEKDSYVTICANDNGGFDAEIFGKFTVKKNVEVGQKDCVTVTKGDATLETDFTGIFGKLIVKDGDKSVVWTASAAFPDEGAIIQFGTKDGINGCISIAPFEATEGMFVTVYGTATLQHDMTVGESDVLIATATGENYTISEGVTLKVSGKLIANGEVWTTSEKIGGDNSLITLAKNSYVLITSNTAGGVDAEIVGKFTVNEDLEISQKDSVTFTKGDVNIDDTVSVYGKLIIKDNGKSVTWTAPAAYPDTDAILQLGMTGDVPGGIFIIPNKETGGVMVTISTSTTIQHDMTIGESDALQIWGMCKINDGVTVKVAGVLQATGKIWTTSEKFDEYNGIIRLAKDSYLLVSANTEGGVDAVLKGAATIADGNNLYIGNKDSLTIDTWNALTVKGSMNVHGKLIVNGTEYIGSNGMIIPADDAYVTVESNDVNGFDFSIIGKSTINEYTLTENDTLTVVKEDVTLKSMNFVYGMLIVKNGDETIIWTASESNPSSDAVFQFGKEGNNKGYIILIPNTEANGIIAAFYDSVRIQKDLTIGESDVAWADSCQFELNSDVQIKIFGVLIGKGEVWTTSEKLAYVSPVINLAKDSYVLVKSNAKGGVDAEIIGKSSIDDKLTIAQKDCLTVTKEDILINTDLITVSGKLVIKDGDNTVVWTAPAIEPNADAVIQFGTDGCLTIIPNDKTNGITVNAYGTAVLQQDMTIGESDIFIASAAGTFVINNDVTLKVSGVLGVNGKIWTTSEKIGYKTASIGLAKDSYVLVKSNTKGGVDAEIVGESTVKNALTIAQKDCITVTKGTVLAEYFVNVNGKLIIKDGDNTVVWTAPAIEPDANAVIQFGTDGRLMLLSNESTGGLGCWLDGSAAIQHDLTVGEGDSLIVSKRELIDIQDGVSVKVSGSLMTNGKAWITSEGFKVQGSNIVLAKDSYVLLTPNSIGGLDAEIFGKAAIESNMTIGKKGSMTVTKSDITVATDLITVFGKLVVKDNDTTTVWTASELNPDSEAVIQFGTEGCLTITPNEKTNGITVNANGTAVLQQDMTIGESDIFIASKAGTFVIDDGVTLKVSGVLIANEEVWTTSEKIANPEAKISLAKDSYVLVKSNAKGGVDAEIVGESTVKDILTIAQKDCITVTKGTVLLEYSVDVYGKIIIKDGDNTVVWTAPAIEPDANAVIQFGTDGNLMLMTNYKTGGAICFLYGSATIQHDLTIGAGDSLIVSKKKLIDIDDGVTIKVSGSLISNENVWITSEGYKIEEANIVLAKDSYVLLTPNSIGGLDAEIFGKAAIESNMTIGKKGSMTVTKSDITMATDLITVFGKLVVKDNDTTTVWTASEINPDSEAVIQFGTEGCLTITPNEKTNGITVNAYGTAVLQHDLTVGESDTFIASAAGTFVISNGVTLKVSGVLGVNGKIWTTSEKIGNKGAIVILAKDSYVTVKSNANGGADTEVIGKCTVSKFSEISQKDSVTVTKGDVILLNDVNIYGKLIMKDNDKTVIWTAPTAYPDKDAIIQLSREGSNDPGLIVIGANEETGGILAILSSGSTLQHDVTIGENDLVNVWYGSCTINEGVTLKVSGVLAVNGEYWTTSEKIANPHAKISLAKDSYVLVKSNAKGGVDAEIVGEAKVTNNLVIAKNDSLTIPNGKITFQSTETDYKTVTVRGELSVRVSDETVKKWIGTDGYVTLDDDASIVITNTVNGFGALIASGTATIHDGFTLGEKDLLAINKGATLNVASDNVTMNGLVRCRGTIENNGTPWMFDIVNGEIDLKGDMIGLIGQIDIVKEFTFPSNIQAIIDGNATFTIKSACTFEGSLINYGTIALNAPMTVGSTGVFEQKENAKFTANNCLLTINGTVKNLKISDDVKLCGTIDDDVDIVFNCDVTVINGTTLRTEKTVRIFGKLTVEDTGTLEGTSDNPIYVKDYDGDQIYITSGLVVIRSVTFDTMTFVHDAEEAAYLLKCLGVEYEGTIYDNTMLVIFLINGFEKSEVTLSVKGPNMTGYSQTVTGLKDGYNVWVLSDYDTSQYGKDGQKFYTGEYDFTISSDQSTYTGFTYVKLSVWDLSMSAEKGYDDCVSWTQTNDVNSYAVITVNAPEFTTPQITLSDNATLVKISDISWMVYSNDGTYVNADVSFMNNGVSETYDVEITEISDGTRTGFNATLTSASDGYIAYEKSSNSAFKIRYVYKTLVDGLWVFTTSGVTEGVNDWSIVIPNYKTDFVSGHGYLDKSDASLVYGYAYFTYEDVIKHYYTSSVTMCISNAQPLPISVEAAISPGKDE